MLESERRENGENIRRFDYLDLISRRKTGDLSPGIRGKKESRNPGYERYCCAKEIFPRGVPITVR